MLHRIAVDDLGIEGHQPDLIERCLSYVRKNRYNPISLAHYAQLLALQEPVPPKSVVFTIDDGFKDQCVVGGDIFGRYDIPLTCFAITDFIDGNLWPWDDQIQYIFESTARQAFTLKLMDNTDFTADLADKPIHYVVKQLRDQLKSMDQTVLYPWLRQLYQAAEVDVPSPLPARFQPASWSDAARFVAQGHCIAPHTCTHRILSQLSREDSHREIVASAERVRQKIPSASAVFAYPTGRDEDFSVREYESIQAAGLLCAVSTHTASSTPQDHQYALPRFPLPTEVSDFIQYLTYIEVAKDRFSRDGVST